MVDSVDSAVLNMSQTSYIGVIYYSSYFLNNYGTLNHISVFVICLALERTDLAYLVRVSMSLGHPQVPVGLSVGKPQVK